MISPYGEKSSRTKSSSDSLGNWPTNSFDSAEMKIVKNQCKGVFNESDCKRCSSQVEREESQSSTFAIADSNTVSMRGCSHEVFFSVPNKQSYHGSHLPPPLHRRHLPQPPPELVSPVQAKLLPQTYTFHASL